MSDIDYFAEVWKGDPIVDKVVARIAELEAHVEHDEDNIEGLQGALVRANQQYTQAEAALAERDRMLRLAILDGEHPAGMDQDYLADLRRRAREETP